MKDNKDAPPRKNSSDSLQHKQEILERKLASFKKNNRRQANNGQDDQGYGYGVSLAVEMFAALIVGFGFGFGLDKWFGTKPWLTIIFGFFGIAAGIFNIIRRISTTTTDDNQPK